MTRVSERHPYHEPQTTIAEVASEGFICQSIVTVKKTVEVDAFSNNPVEVLNFDDFAKDYE